MDPTDILFSQLESLDPSSAMPTPSADGFPSTADQPYNDFPDTQSLYSGSCVPLFVFCQMAKRQFGLKGQAAVSMENFCQPISTDERLGLVFASVLQLISMKEDDTAHDAETYVLPENLKTLCKVYTPAYLMCPQASACRGIDAAVHIANAMRESYQGIVPAADDVARMSAVLKYINKNLTSYRNIIKGKIDASHGEGWNIAKLAHALVGKGPNAPKPTLQVYLRAAFWRWVYVSYPDLEVNKFWIKVDSVLSSFRAKTAVDCTAAMNRLYDMDKEKYGDPANDNAFPVADPSTIPAWQLTLFRHAALVAAPVELSNTVTTRRKRRRTSEVVHDEETGSQAGMPTEEG
ncbi:hypothetical protein C8F01DRAFT_1230200 [Mycena amicta]|nr:hypothetical protein C8F01DRAFT_1230200 [Mycena amicta]